MNKTLNYLLCVSLLFAGAAIAVGATSLSQHLVALSKHSAGICSMPRCGDGQLVMQIAHDSNLLVHALSVKSEEVADTQQAADKAGLLGRSVYIEQGDLAHNPLADWCADVLFITDASDKELSKIPQQQVCRVLAPYRGVAIVGRAKQMGGGLSRFKLDNWLKGMNVPDGKIVEDDFGLWAVATMPALKGGDDWSHYAHGADQNRYSMDEALKWPYLMQWTAKPYYDGKFDIAVAAGGRLFRANVTLSIGGTMTNELTARSAYNGCVLWTRKLDGDFGTFGSLIVSTPDVVYLKDGNGVLCLDGETGADIKRFSLSTDPQTECRWLLQQDGVLVTVLGARPPLPDGKTLQASFDAVGSTFPVQRKWFQEYDQGTDLVAFDVTTGKEIWRQQTAGLDPAKIAISADRVFFYAERQYASCLDLHTGKAIWKTDAPIEKDPLGQGWSITFMVTDRVAAVVSPDVYLINSYKDGHYQAFSAKDGAILWGKGHGRAKDVWNDADLGKFTYPVLMGSRIVDKGGTMFSALTGKATGEGLPLGNSAVGDICGPFCVSKHYVFGGGGPAYDLDSKTLIPARGYMKTACLTGIIPADGLLFSGHGNCAGCMEWLGHMAFRSADGIALDDPASVTDRLYHGKATDTAAMVSTPADWTTYRADNSRCSSSSASVAETAKVLWTWTPNPAFNYFAEAGKGLETASTQAICIGDRVYFGTSTGVIRCLERKNGNEVWNYPTAGRIISAPSFWEGKLYVGSGDGRVYCLDAGTGSLLWRYRVAPIERRIMVYGHLMSAWPVNANVLLAPSTEAGKHGAVAYASAGLLGATGACYLCALDARTGKPRWETSLNDACAPDPTQVSFIRTGAGMSFALDGKIDTGAAGCAPEAVYHALRLGTSPTTYTFEKLKPLAKYTLRVHFVEPWEKEAGKRVMDLTLNAQPWLKTFDIYAEAGGQNKAIMRETVTAADKDGKLAIHFAPSPGFSNAIVLSGIEILDGATAIYKLQAGGSGVAQAGFVNDVESSGEVYPVLPSATGQMAWYDGKLWLHAGDSGVLIVDPLTGKAAQAIDCDKLAKPMWLATSTFRHSAFASSRGQDIGILPGGFVVWGGKQFFLPSNTLGQPSNTSVFLRATPDAVPSNVNGYPDFTGLAAQGNSDMPVWDAKETLLCGARNPRVTPILCHGLCDFLSVQLTAHPINAAKSGWNIRTQITESLSADHTRPALPVNMRSREFFSPLLTANAVIFLSGNGDEYKNWHVVAVSRKDANVLWDVSLPFMPVVGGLSTTNAGDVLVPMVDGRMVCVGI